MTEMLSSPPPLRVNTGVDNGLEPGYAEDKWGPWKSHKLLLSEAIANDAGWGSRAGMSLTESMRI